LITSELGLAEQSNSFNESEMALFYECMLKCAQKVIDTADIVRDAMLRQLTKRVQPLVDWQQMRVVFH
jgi:hypothetical protein